MTRAMVRATAQAFGALAFAVVAAAVALLTVSAGPAEALPSYARQTGQPCATCHTAFPE
jgi:mono/diheme cytochrome c family protein